MFVAKLDSQGKTIWKECLGGTNSEQSYWIIQTQDGGYAVAGATTSNDGDVSGLHQLAGGGTDAWVVKLDGTGKIQWQHCYGGSKSDAANSIIQTADGGYAFAGTTLSSDGDVSGFHGGVNGDIWMVKLDGSGNIQWQKCLGGTDYEVAHSIIQTQDKGYVITGVTSSNDGDVSGNRASTQYNTIWVVKLDQTGNMKWQHCYGGTDGNEEAKQVIQTSDGGYAIAGMTNSTNGDVTGYHGGSWDDWILRLDPGGNLIWQKCIGGSNNEEGMSIVQTDDGGFTYTGCCNSTDGDPLNLLHHGKVDVWLVHLDPPGTIEWQELLGGSEIDFANQLIHTADDGYALIGWTGSNDGDVLGNHNVIVNDIWIVKLGCIPATTSIYLKNTTINPRPGDSVDIPIYMNSSGGTATLLGIASETLNFSMNPDLITPVRFIPALPGLLLSGMTISGRTTTISLLDSAGFSIAGETLIGYLRCATYVTDSLQTSVVLTDESIASSKNLNCVSLAETEDSIIVSLANECGEQILSRYMKYDSTFKILSITPNPAGKNVNVAFRNNGQVVQYDIFDALGNTMKHGAASENLLRLEVSDIPTGNYYFRMINSEGKEAAESLMILR